MKIKHDSYVRDYVYALMLIVTVIAMVAIAQWRFPEALGLAQSGAPSMATVEAGPEEEEPDEVMPPPMPDESAPLTLAGAPQSPPSAAKPLPTPAPETPQAPAPQTAGTHIEPRLDQSVVRDVIDPPADKAATMPTPPAEVAQKPIPAVDEVASPEPPAEEELADVLPAMVMDTDFATQAREMLDGDSAPALALSWDPDQIRQLANQGYGFIIATVDGPHGPERRIVSGERVIPLTPEHIARISNRGVPLNGSGQTHRTSFEGREIAVLRRYQVEGDIRLSFHFSSGLDRQFVATQLQAVQRTGCTSPAQATTMASLTIAGEPRIVVTSVKCSGKSYAIAN